MAVIVAVPSLLLPLVQPVVRNPSSDPVGQRVATQAAVDNVADKDDDEASENANDNATEPWPSPRMLAQAARAASLDAYANDASRTIISAQERRRPGLLTARQRLQSSGDVAGVARLNAVLSTEAFARAARTTTRWLDRRDTETGLFPHTLKPKGRYWSYGDVGSDLLPFLAIGAQQLVPQRYPEILATLAAERQLTAGFPRDVDLDGLQPLDRTVEKQMLGNVEYGKDGLLPIVELLGADPWGLRMRQIVHGVLTQSKVPTTRGPIPSDAAEVNGSLLQVLARLSWTDGDPRYLEMGRRISAAYLDDALPKTGQIPPQHWDFVAGKPIDDRALHLGDHGSEIVSGLIEWQRVASRHGFPEEAQHRAAITQMLDRLLQTGRTPAGLWYDGISYPHGTVINRELNDNWGYLGQAYLNHAAQLRAAADGDALAAERFEAAAATMLQAVTELDFYVWERGDMDGYADTLESALYLLHRIGNPTAEQWVHEQMPVLYGFQKPNGSVTDENIDGNFVRTAMLYGRWLTQGARLEPWAPTASLGSAVDGPCLQLHLHAAQPWSGVLKFDTERHRLNLGLPEDYPRLNEWPEWWTAKHAHQYTVTRPDGTTEQLQGDALAAGLPITLTPGAAVQYRVCGG